MSRSDSDPPDGPGIPDIDELAKLMMAWTGLSMRLHKSTAGMKLLAEAGLTLQQVAALHVLMFDGPSFVSALTDRLDLSLSATSHLVQKMVEAGYFTRVEDEDDRRQKLVSITPAGRKLVEKLMKARFDEMRGSLMHLSDRLRTELAPVLRSIVGELATFVKTSGEQHSQKCDWQKRGGNLRGQNLEGADFTGVVIPDARFDGSNLEGATFAGARLERARFDGANVEGADLTSATLTDARFDGANVEGADFADANLEGARFDGANLEGAVFDGANVRRVRFRGSSLDGATFEGADLDGASFESCSLEGVSFEGAKNIPNGWEAT